MLTWLNIEQKHPDVWIVSNYHDYWSLELVSDWPCNHGNVEKLFDLWITLCSKPVFKGHSEKKTRGHFLRTISYLANVKEPVMKGHVKTGFTVTSGD